MSIRKWWDDWRSGVRRVDPDEKKRRQGANIDLSAVIPKTDWRDVVFSRIGPKTAHSSIAFNDCTFTDCDLAAQIDHTFFTGCTFTRCSFGPRDQIRPITQVDFTDCRFVLCDFRGASLNRVRFLGDSRFEKVRFSAQTLVANVDFAAVKGLHTAYGLHHARQEKSAELDLVGFNHHFQAAHVPFRLHRLNWEILSILGRLPLFGISLATVVSIPIVMFGVGLWNSQLRSLRLWATEHGDHVPLKQMIARLNYIEIPHLSLTLLVSTVLLGIASLLYSIACPQRIKEFSLARWLDELGGSALHYVPLSWTRPGVRYVVAFCYLAGGLGTLYVLIVKVWRAGVFIWENT